MQHGSSPAPPWPHAPAEPLTGGLYVVGTPIGNLQDISLRALSVLKGASLVCAEDTRHTRKLLNYFGIRAQMMSYHAHNELLRQDTIIQRLQAGEALALVSDAGMPGISDPGYLLVRAAIDAGVRVVPVPGPCAFVAALVASGLSTDSFQFCGFLPPKPGARRARLSSLSSHPSTLLFYVPPHSLAAVLADCVAALGGWRRACVARELTKVHEEMFRSTLAEALEEFTVRREPRGEIVLVVEGAPPAGQPGTGAGPAGPSVAAGGGASDAGAAAGPSSAPAAAQAEAPSLESRALPLLVELIGSGLPVAAASKRAAKELRVGRKALYSLALKAHAQVAASAAAAAAAAGPKAAAGCELGQPPAGAESGPGAPTESEG